MDTSSSSIQIYSGNGVSQILVEDWKREIASLLDPRKYIVHEFKENETFKEPKHISLVILPGGYTPFMVEGIASIAQSVKSTLDNYSARLIGSCAGAIAVSSSEAELSFNRDTFSLMQSPFEPCYTDSSGLPLNDVKTIVPYYTPDSLQRGTSNLNNLTTVEVEMNSKYLNDIEERTCKVYHAYGPCFVMMGEDRSRYTILEKYISPGNVPFSKEPAATILYDRGPKNNSILLTGIHPETKLQSLKSKTCRTELNDEYQLQRLAKLLKDGDETRTIMLKSWFTELKLQLRD